MIIEAGMILMILKGTIIPFGFIEYPCPQEYETNKIVAVASNEKFVRPVNNYDIICIAKVDYEK